MVCLKSIFKEEKPIKLPAFYNRLTPVSRRFIREEYIRLQKNLCWHCNQSLDINPTKNKHIKISQFPSNFFKWPIHLHHDHETGLTIGAVHAYCNAVLWMHYGE